MRHVFVETNWVVDVAAPSYWRKPEAKTLLQRAQAGELRLHVPSICLLEARETIRRKFTVRGVRDPIRVFLAWGTRERHLERAEADRIRRTLEAFERSTRRELESLPATLDALRDLGEQVDVFPMDDAALELQVELGASELSLKSPKSPDLAILAAVVSRARSLRMAGATDICFCELDSDLQPWAWDGNRKPFLTRLYDEAGVWVYGDYALRSPEQPASWPP